MSCGAVLHQVEHKKARPSSAQLAASHMAMVMRMTNHDIGGLPNEGHGNAVECGNRYAAGV